MTRTILKIKLFFFLASVTLYAGVNQWTPIGPDGATVVQLVRAPSNPTVLYALCQQAVVYSSRDGGLHWKMIRELPTNGLLRMGRFSSIPTRLGNPVSCCFQVSCPRRRMGANIGKKILLPEGQLFLHKIYSPRSSQPTNGLRFDRQQPFEIVGWR